MALLFLSLVFGYVICGLVVSLQQLLDLGEENWKLGLYRVPHELVINEIVAVDQDVAERDDALVLAHS